MNRRVQRDLPIDIGHEAEGCDVWSLSPRAPAPRQVVRTKARVVT